MKNFMKWDFLYYQAASVFCETNPFIVVKEINSNNKFNSQSMLENQCGGGGGGGKINQLG